MKNKRKTSEAERAAEHISKIHQMVDYLNNTPAEERPSDRGIYRQFESSALGLERARYMIKHGVTAEEAVRISNAAKQAKKTDSVSGESMAGKSGLSLEWLTRSFRVAA